jgi:gas vesicle protein
MAELGFDEIEIVEIDDDVTPLPSSSPSPAGFLTGLFLGLLGGTVLAMIAAPQSGEETRDMLRAKAREAADRTRDRAEDVSQTVSGTTNDLLERGRSIVEQARARVDASVAEGKDAAELHRSELDNLT